MTKMKPLVAVIMGSRSDWEAMSRCTDILDRLGIPFDAKVFSAHRTPDLLFAYLQPLRTEGVEVIVAGAGCAAHLPGVIAAKCPLPVIGVPMESKALKGMDSLLSIAQMPAGIPVGTMAIGTAGAANAALFAAAIMANKHPDIRESLDRFRTEQTEKGGRNTDPRADPV
ncbi:MAG: 5-(carboxyamino)imidazole ribonucleotide mutase [Gammaproteobacteria bacterium]|nr:5-(carboxyamino)imidazole ribonucleotide mutase [Gammaproteobacteria bacterium]